MKKPRYTDQQITEALRQAESGAGCLARSSAMSWQ
jgi:hypothetical protein